MPFPALLINFSPLSKGFNLHPLILYPGMTDLSKFDPNAPSNPNNNIFGLPFTEDDAKLILLPVPWEVTVSCTAGTARSAEQYF